MQNKTKEKKYLKNLKKDNNPNKRKRAQIRATEKYIETHNNPGHVFFTASAQSSIVTPTVDLETTLIEDLTSALSFINKINSSSLKKSELIGIIEAHIKSYNRQELNDQLSDSLSKLQEETDMILIKEQIARDLRSLKLRHSALNRVHRARDTISIEKILEEASFPYEIETFIKTVIDSSSDYSNEIVVRTEDKKIVANANELINGELKGVLDEIITTIENSEQKKVEIHVQNTTHARIEPEIVKDFITTVQDSLEKPQEPNYAKDLSEAEKITNQAMKEFFDAIDKIRKIKSNNSKIKNLKDLDALIKLSDTLFENGLKFWDEPSDKNFRLFSEQCKESINNVDNSLAKRQPTVWRKLILPQLNRILQALNSVLGLLGVSKSHHVKLFNTQSKAQIKWGEIKPALLEILENPDFKKSARNEEIFRKSNPK